MKNSDLLVFNEIFSRLKKEESWGVPWRENEKSCKSLHQPTQITNPTNPSNSTKQPTQPLNWHHVHSTAKSWFDHSQLNYCIYLSIKQCTWSSLSSLWFWVWSSWLSWLSNSLILLVKQLVLSISFVSCSPCWCHLQVIINITSSSSSSSSSSSASSSSSPPSSSTTTSSPSNLHHRLLFYFSNFF